MPVILLFGFLSGIIGIAFGTLAAIDGGGKKSVAIALLNGLCAVWNFVSYGASAITH